MEKATTKFVIDYFMNSNEFDFKDFDITNVIEEITPLFKTTLENYLFLKKQNPKNIPKFKAEFIQKKK